MRRIDADDLKWIKKPQRYLLTNEKVILETEPNTALSKKRPGAEAIELSLEPDGSFCFSVRVDFAFKGRFDQCGILLYQGEKRIAFCCTMHNNTAVDELECVVFHDRFGDRSSRDIGTAIQWMYYRVWYRSGNVTIQYSFNGKVYSDLRQFWIHDTGENISIGIYACSPSDSSFDCTFSEMILQEEGKEEIE